MSLIGPDGFVNLSPSRLSLLECPRRGKELLGAPRTEPGIPARKGLAAHATLAALARRGSWPDDAFGAIPGLTRIALRSDWPSWASDPERFEGELADLVDMLRQFVFAWAPPTSASPHVESWAEFEHRESKLRITGRLDLLVPPDDTDGWVRVLDYKSGRQPLSRPSDGAAPLSVIAQAALARAKLGIKAPVEVRHVYLRTNGEDAWSLDQHTLAQGWRGIRELAGEIHEGHYPAVPGEHCHRCSAQCEWAARTVDAGELGLVDDSEGDGA